MKKENQKTDEKIQRKIKEKLDSLLALSVEDIAGLLENSSEEITLDGNKIILTIWHERLDSEEHRVVVQAYKPGILGVGRMYADGFVIDGQNKQRSLSLEEWSLFS